MGLSNKKCLFLIQGEGRGHMTQSISMKQLVESAGMSVSEVLIGKSKRRKIPGFYYEKIKVPVTLIESPNMSTGKNSKAIKTFPSLLGVIIRMPKFIHSLFIIHRKVKEHKPDVIINFYEPLAGLYHFFFRSKIPMICIGHQFLMDHPDFEMPEGHLPAKIGFKMYNWLISIGAKKKLALSFYPFSDSAENSIYVIPPLLREEVLNQPSTKGEYLLVYLLNAGYMEDIIKWHNNNRHITLHCFTDNKDVVNCVEYDSSLFFHQLNDQKFLDMMANSKGLVSTAGFESVCEAMYLGKPVFMVPVEGHYEQFCNSRDAAKAGAGIYDSSFEIDRFLTFVSNFYTDNRQFKEWANQSQMLTLKHIHGVIYENNTVRELRPLPIFNKKVAYNN